MYRYTVYYTPDTINPPSRYCKIFKYYFTILFTSIFYATSLLCRNFLIVCCCLNMNLRVPLKIKLYPHNILCIDGCMRYVITWRHHPTHLTDGQSVCSPYNQRQSIQNNKGVLKLFSFSCTQQNTHDATLSALEISNCAYYMYLTIYMIYTRGIVYMARHIIRIIVWF